MKIDKIWVYTAATLAALFWGFSFVWFKQALLVYRPITIVFLRLVIASIVLNIFIKTTGKTQHVTRKDLKLFLLLAFFEPFCYFLGESFGLTFVSATIGAIIISTIPLFTPFITYFLIKEKITIYGIIGLIISFFGVLLIVVKDYSGTSTIKGVILMFIAVFFAIGYGIIVKKLTVKYSGFTIVKWQNIFGMIYFLPVFLIFNSSHFISVTHTLSAIITISKLAIFPSTLSFILIAYVIRKIGLINANIFANLIPVFTAIIAYIILKESLDSQKVFGILIVICGLFISQIPQFRRKK
ncbi:MAG: DMT family transporter [Flavobacteriaceae bacterium]|nr:DMT family transporter [Flavobacteriaceae bacterium]